jgi:Mn-dependent DtxR family transcriptional regulator
MLQMLKHIADGKGREIPGVKPQVVTQAYSALKSRGWVNHAGQLTDAGRSYLETCK